MFKLDCKYHHQRTSETNLQILKVLRIRRSEKDGIDIVSQKWYGCYPCWKQVTVQRVLVSKYGASQTEAVTICQNFLETFRDHQEEEGVSLDDWRCSLWRQSLGVAYESIAEELYEHWLEVRYQYLQPKEEVLTMLRCLKTRYYLALITNGFSRSQWEKIHRLQLEEYFHCILVSGDLGWLKPHKAIFLLACEHLHTPPHECIMVGDRLNTDILGAENAALGASVWIPLDETTTDDVHVIPDVVIPDVLLLPNLLAPPKLKPNLNRYLDLSEPESENSNCSES